MHKRDDELIFIDEDFRNSVFYRVSDVFLNDDRKNSLLTSLVVRLAVLVGKYSFLKNVLEIKEDFNIKTYKTPKYIFVVDYMDHNPNNELTVLFKPKKGFLTKWKIIDFSKDMTSLVKKSNNVGKTIEKILDNKIFW